MTAVHKKRADDELEHKYRYFMLHRWDLIRQHREACESSAKKRLNIKKQTTKWIKLGLTYLMLKTIHAKFAVHLGEVKLRENKCRSSSKIGKLFKLHLAKFETGHNNRDIRKVRNSANAFATSMIELAREKARFCMTDYLIRASELYHLKKAFLDFGPKRIIPLQRRLRAAHALRVKLKASIKA